MKRWTNDQLKNTDDLTFSIGIMSERQYGLNPNAPLFMKLAQSKLTIHELKESKVYAVILGVGHYRTGAIVGNVLCIVKAKNRDEAFEKAWEKAGNDHCCHIDTMEVDLSDPWMYTIMNT